MNRETLIYCFVASLVSSGVVFGLFHVATHGKTPSPEPVTRESYIYQQAKPVCECSCAPHVNVGVEKEPKQ